MKWYFASNDKSPDFFPLIMAAVNSALENTTLEPNFLYDGAENELTAWLRKKGVNVIFHRISFYDSLKEHFDDYGLTVSSGAFLRCDIPIIEDEDEIILYTDCDVLFLKDPKIDLKPEFFACSSQFTKRNFVDFNTGSMVMNVKKLRESYQEFKYFIEHNLGLLTAFDQTAYQIFYRKNNTKLNIEFNHKPYWGVSENASIVHFHGAKPTAFTSAEALQNMGYMHTKLYRKNPEAYDYYLQLFKKYFPSIEYDYESIKKLKSKEYPLNKQKGTPLINRAVSRFIKEYKKFKMKNL